MPTANPAELMRLIGFESCPLSKEVKEVMKLLEKYSEPASFELRLLGWKPER